MFLQVTFLSPLLTLFLVLSAAAPSWAEPTTVWWTYPYLQNVNETSAELYWVESGSHSRTVKVGSDRFFSWVRPAPELHYHPVELQEFDELVDSPPRFLHRVRLEGLQSGRTVSYQVELEEGRAPYQASFRTIPEKADSIRFAVFSDSETEPESTGKRARWANEDDPKRRYPLDQTEGFAANLAALSERELDFLVIAGDLVESGGEQRDWDEFWRHLTSKDGSRSLAGRVPLLATPGNHEYYAGPRHGRFETEASRAAIAKFFSYFHPNGPDRRAHYFSKVYGPMRLIFLDSCDGTPHGGEGDPNHFLEAAPEFSPGIGPESEQYRWLERELREAQQEQSFTFVVFHHVPYSSGPHGKPPGDGPDEDTQSGVPLRVWTPLFHRYGVAAVFSGHDEIFERSEVPGVEVLPDGSERPYSLQVYDVGVGGDGLRAPVIENPYSAFRADMQAPEVWVEGHLVEGGRHYGHLEVQLSRGERGWSAELRPVYLLPRESEGGGWTFQRRTYPDLVTLPGRMKQP